MKKQEVKEVETYKNQWGETVYPTESSLSMIAVTLSNLEHGLSSLKVDNNITDETDLRGVESKLTDIQESISDSSHALYEIDSKLESISESLKTISNGIETFIGWYIENSKK
jgi:septation ring formation regulator EzrA